MGIPHIFLVWTGIFTLRMEGGKEDDTLHAWMNSSSSLSQVTLPRDWVLSGGAGLPRFPAPLSPSASEPGKVGHFLGKKWEHLSVLHVSEGSWCSLLPLQSHNHPGVPGSILRHRLHLSLPRVNFLECFLLCTHVAPKTQSEAGRLAQSVNEELAEVQGCVGPKLSIPGHRNLTLFFC